MRTPKPGSRSQSLPFLLYFNTAASLLGPSCETRPLTHPLFHHCLAQAAAPWASATRHLAALPPLALSTAHSPRCSTSPRLQWEASPVSRLYRPECSPFIPENQIQALCNHGLQDTTVRPGSHLPLWPCRAPLALDFLTCTHTTLVSALEPSLLPPEMLTPTCRS